MSVSFLSGKGNFELMFWSGNAGNDPEVASSCIDLTERFIPRYLQVFLSPNVRNTVPSLFSFSLTCLVSTEIMPKRSAAVFWVGIGALS